MPELPEVETIRLGLQKYLVGHTIASIDVRLKKILTGNPDELIGAKITKVERFGKGLVISFDNALCLAIHIKMTGQLIYQGKDEPKGVRLSEKVGGELPNKYTHIIFHLDKGATLFYNDLRQFGWLKIIEHDRLQELPFFKDLGPEFLKNLTEEQFAKILSSQKTAIKPLLMDQKKIAGVGNIYANDALYAARIDPRRKANSLSAQEVKSLFLAMLQVLQKGIAEGGSSAENYVNALGLEGHYQEHTLVYGREGQKCSRDGGKIRKFMLGGRGTYMCDICQR